MPFTRGQPPGPHAGDMSPLTGELRPPISLPPDLCETARKMRRGGREIGEIASRLDVPVEEVRQALATMRTRRQSASRRSLNVTVAAHEYIIGEAAEDEACWETVDRLLVELAIRRAFSMAPTAKK